MYLSHWGLNHSPFHVSAGLAEAYPSQAFQEAAARIDYLVGERRRVGALVGEPGLGKSTILRSLAPTLARRGAGVAVIDALALSTHEFLWRIASQLGSSPDAADDPPRLWRRIEDTLSHARLTGEPVVLLVDDVDQAGPDIERQLVRLAALESSPAAQWTILFTTGPQRLGYLNPSLLDRVDLRVDLYPWNEEDVVGYVQHALVEAGRMAPIFSEEALSRLQACTVGVPRHVLRLADFALVAGAGQGIDQIGPELIDNAFQELRFSLPQGAHLV